MMDMIRRIMSKEEQLNLAAKIKAERDQKLHELGRMIRGTPVSAGTRPGPGTKGASLIDNNPKPKITIRYRPILNEKLKMLGELGKMVRGH
jgi:hypothetical protein